MMSLLNLPLALGPWQIILIAIVILLLFGGKKIPELMKGLGGGLKKLVKKKRKILRTIKFSFLTLSH